MVADGLGGDEGPEVVGLVGDRAPPAGVGVDDLHRHHGVGAALVELARRMEEARPVAGGGGRARRGGRGPGAGATRGRRRGRRGDRPGARRSRRGARSSSSQAQTPRRSAVSTAGSGRCGEDVVGVALGLGHVGLVEGVDPEHVPAQGGGHLPSEELLAEVGGPLRRGAARRGGRDRPRARWWGPARSPCPACPSTRR